MTPIERAIKTSDKTALPRNYRAYLIDENNRIETAQEVIANDDEAAIADMQTLAAGRVFELWDGARKVARVGRQRS